MSEFKLKFFDSFNDNFAVGNLQLSVGKLQLSARPQLFKPTTSLDKVILTLQMYYRSGIDGRGSIDAGTYFVFAHHMAARTRDREVLGSTPGQCTAGQQLWASC